MERDVAGLVALAGDRDRAGDYVDVLATDCGDLADAQAGIGGEKDHRPSPPGHTRAQQDGQVLVGDRARSALGDLGRSGNQGGVIRAPSGADQP